MCKWIEYICTQNESATSFGPECSVYNSNACFSFSVRFGCSVLISIFHSTMHPNVEQQRQIVFTSFRAHFISFYFHCYYYLLLLIIIIIIVFQPLTIIQLFQISRKFCSIFTFVELFFHFSAWIRFGFWRQGYFAACTHLLFSMNLLIRIRLAVPISLRCPSSGIICFVSIKFLVLCFFEWWRGKIQFPHHIKGLQQWRRLEEILLLNSADFSEHICYYGKIPSCDWCQLKHEQNAILHETKLCFFIVFA